MAAHGSIIVTSEEARQFQWGTLARAVGMVVVLALTVVLRFEGLSRQSLWADEGNSWGMALRSLAEIGPAAGADIHPPLYYYLLNLWCRLFGTSEAGMRSLSALFGCLTVIVVCLWARRLAGEWAAVAAGALAAISPFAVYYSQEARAYALVALLAATSCWLLSEYLLAQEAGRGSRGWAWRYWAISAALLWSHYLGLTVLVLHNLIMVAWLVRRPDAVAQLKRWALIQAAVLVVFLPWLPTMLGSAGTWPAISSLEPLSFYLQETVRLFSLGPGSESLTSWAWWALAPALAGLVLAPVRGRHRLLAVLVVLAALWPALALWLLSYVRPAYRAKFLLLGLPAYHVLAGAGIVWLGSLIGKLVGRRLGWVIGLVAATALGALALPASATGLEAYRSGEGVVRDDYRGLAAYLEAATGAEAAIVLNAPGQIEVFSYYYRGDAQLYALPASRPADLAQLETTLESIAEDHPRVYSVLWATTESDPTGFMEEWLDTHTYKASDVWYGNVRLTEHELPEATSETDQPDVVFGDLLTLEDYSLRSDGVRPGQAAPVDLGWRLKGTPSAEVALFIQVLDGRSNIVGQRDTLPLSGRYPVTQWIEGELVVDRQAVPVLLGTPPGSYRVVMGLYDAGTGVRLLLADGADYLELGQIEVLPAEEPLNAAALRTTSAQDVALGPLRLVGWDVSPLGGTASSTVTAAAGSPLSLAFYWRVQEQASVQLEFALEKLVQSRPIGQVEALAEALPVESWVVGQTYRDPHIVFLPGDLESGEYRLSVRATAGEGQGEVDLGRVVVP